MKSIRKRAPLWFVCVLCMIIAAAFAMINLPSAFADEQEGVLTYTLNDAGTEATITDCAENATAEDVAAAFDEICSPGGIRVRDIVTIGDNAFNSCADLTNIIIPDSVTRIGGRAFLSCRNLTSVHIPDSVTSIGDAAFYICPSLTSIDIPISLTSIGNQVFYGCSSLTNIYIPAGVTSIGIRAFQQCKGLISVTIPDSVTTINAEAFSSCSNLTNISIPTYVTSIGESAFAGCSGLININIPAYVTSIGENVFEGCSSLYEITVDPVNAYFVNDEYCVLFDKMQTLLIQYPTGNSRSEYTVPDSVTNIGNAFRGCIGLTSVNIPDGVTTITNSAFEGCTGLTSVDIPNGVTSIGVNAFYNCTNLEAVTIPVSVTSIAHQAFYGCSSLIEIAVDPANSYFVNDEYGVLFDSAMTTLIKFPVGNNFLSDYTIPAGVTDIGINAFSGCSALTSISIPNSVTNISDSAFWSCTGLISVTIPDGVTIIGNNAFRECYDLTSIAIPNSLVSIGPSAFYHCYNLTGSITMPADLISIGPSAFTGCYSLSEIIVEHGMTDLPIYFLTESTFNNNLRLYVPTSIISVGGQPVFSTGLPANTTLSGKPTIYGIEGSFINAWAKANTANGAKLTEISGKVTKFDYDDAWLNVPYQYIIETMMPDNVELKFNLTDYSGALPNGLGLMQVDDVYDGLMMLSGQFYGAPLETGDFIFTVEVRSKVYNYLLDTQEITLHVDSPSDAVLLDTVNDYDITTSIGAIDLDGAYWVTVFDDQVYEIADADLDGDGMIERNFPDFVHFWIDGKVLERDTDYDADEGSTVVTVYAKTFQALDDGAVHTASAEFSIKGVQTVAAQNFRVNLSEPVPEEKPNPDPDPEPEQKPDPEPEPGSDPEPDPEQEPNTDPDPDTEPGSDPDPNTDPDPSPDQNTPLPGGTSGGGYTTAAPAQPGTEPTGPAVLTTPNDTSAADEISPAAPVTTLEAPITIAEDTNAGDGDTNPAGTAGAAAIDGLPRDENGLFYFMLDGSGAPLEARIDVPLADFADMYFDGELWMPGEDYETREGSTILVIAAEKLAGLTYGLHEISARFTEDRTVSFAFDLRGPAPAAGPETGPATPAENAANAALAAGSGLPAAPFVIAAVAIVLLIAAAFILRARRLRRAG